MIERLPSPYPVEMPPTIPDPPTPYRAGLCARITHPDILCRILALLPRTHLPSAMRASRELHALAGPLLYADLSLPLSGLALPPHISPIGSLLDRAACSSPADQHALLAQTSFLTRQRSLLQSARTLRLGYHSHHVLPRIMRDLALDMSRVDTLHLEGSAVCHHEQCPTIRNLRPKVISIEAMSLDAVSRPIEEVDIRGVSGMNRVEHVVVRLRPTSLGVFPTCHAARPAAGSQALHSRRKARLTVVLTANTYIDGSGCTIHQPWRPSRFSPCGTSGTSGLARSTTTTGGAYPTPKPSFCDFVAHVARACVLGGWAEVRLVGAEIIDESWVRGCVMEHRWKCDKEVQHGPHGHTGIENGGGLGCDGKGCMSVSEVVQRQINGQVAMEQDKLADSQADQGHGAGWDAYDQEMSFSSRKQWEGGAEGYLLDEPELGMGYKGKGRLTGSRPGLPKSHSAVR